MSDESLDRVQKSLDSCPGKNLCSFKNGKREEVGSREQDVKSEKEGATG